jgi:e3 binding domain
MAEKTPKSKRSDSRRGQSTSARNGSRGSSRNGKGDSRSVRPALQARRQANDSDVEYRRYVQREEQDPAGPPDVLLDVPELKVDLIHFELDDLDAHVALKANVLNLVKLNVGVDVHLSKVKLDIKGVEAQVVLKARLDHVSAIVDRLMTSLDRNPELVKGLSRAVADLGQGAGEAVDKTGDAAKDVGKGAQGALKDVGKGAGEATGDIGQGAGQAVGDIGQGTGQAVGDVGQGAGQAVGDVGQGAGQAAGSLDQVVGGVGQTLGQAGQAVGGVAQGAGQGGAPSADGGGAEQAEANGGGPAGAKPTALAKEVAKLFAREIGHAASDEARDLGLAATRKVRELGERREQRRAEKYQATEAAVRMADELGIDLAEIDGTGSEGRITVKDVREAQEA